MSNINDVLADLRSKGNALERYGLYWSESDLDDLRTFFAEGIGTSDIAVYMQRTEVAIYQQLLKLGVLAHQCVPRARRERAVCRGCLCPTCSNPSCEYHGKEHPNAGNL